MFCFLMVLKFLSSVINKTENDNKHEQTNERQLKHNFLHVKQMCVVFSVIVWFARDQFGFAPFIV